MYFYLYRINKYEIYRNYFIFSKFISKDYIKEYQLYYIKFLYFCFKLLPILTRKILFVK